MNHHSDFHRIIFQRILSNAFAVQERRDLAALRSARLQAKKIASEPAHAATGEVTDPAVIEEESFVPVFSMLPQNQYTFYARCRFVLLDMMKLPGLRQVARLGIILARRTSAVSPQQRQADFVPARGAPKVPQAAQTRQTAAIPNTRRTWRTFAPAAVAAGIARRANNFTWPRPWHDFSLATVAAGLMGRTRSVRWPHPFKNSAPAKFVSELAMRARTFYAGRRWQTFAHKSFASAFAQVLQKMEWPHLRRKFASAYVAVSFARRIKPRPEYRTKILGSPKWDRNFTNFVSGFGLRQNLRRSRMNWSKLSRPKLNFSDLWRYSAPAVVIVVVLAFTLEMVHQRPSLTRSNLVTTVESPTKAAETKTVEPPLAIGANTRATNATDRRSFLPKPAAGKLMPAAEIASASPKAAEATPTAVKTALRRVRVGANEIDYIGDDVTVKRFVDPGSERRKKRSRELNRRVAHIGDDVTVRYFAPTAPTRAAAQ